MTSATKRLGRLILIAATVGVVLVTPVSAFAFNGPASGQSAGTGNGAIGVGSNENISIGTSTTQAAAKLIVVASDTADTANYVFKVLDSSQNPLLVIRNDGSIGIGTATFTDTGLGALNVAGLVYSGAGLTGSLSAQNVSAGTFGNNTGGGSYIFPGNVTVGASVGSTGLILGSDGFNPWEIYAAYSYTNSDLIFDSNGSEKLRVNENGEMCLGYTGAQGCTGDTGLIVNGNVGIGTASPGAPLDIYNAGASSFFHLTGGSPVGSYYLNARSFSPQGGAESYAFDVVNDGTTYSNDLVFSGVNGNVGIGTTNPGQQLTVANDLAITATADQQFILIGNQNNAGVNNPGMIGGTNGGLTFGHGNSWSGTGGTFTPTMYLANDGGLELGTGAATYSDAGAGNLIVSGTLTAGNLSGLINAGNVSAGTFGNNSGGGTYTFPGTLSANGDIENTNPSLGYLGLTGDLPGYSTGEYPTLRTSYEYLYFAANDDYTAALGSPKGNGLFQLNGAGTVVLNTSGNSYFDGGSVGIGTATPGKTLEVLGTINAIDGSGDAAALSADSSGGHLWANGSYSQGNSGANWVEDLTFTPGGDVGIGTASPTSILTVNGGGTHTWNVFSESNYNYLTFNGVTSNTGTLVGMAGGGGSDTNLYLYSGLSDGGATMTLSGSDVGIGTTSPGGTLEVVTANSGPTPQFSFIRSTPGGVGIALNTTAQDWSIGNSAGLGGLSIGNSNDFDTNDMLFIENGTGDIGVGTTTPATLLTVAGNANITGTLTAGTFTGTLNAANVSSGEFGGNTGGGLYIFPGVVEMNSNVIVDGGSSSNWAELNVGGSYASINAGGSIYSYTGICTGNTAGNCTSSDGVVLSPSGSNTYGNVYITGSGNTYFDGGNVGIGTTAPQVPLDIGGGVGVRQLVYGTGGNAGYLMGFGVDLIPGMNSLDAFMGYGNGSNTAFNIDYPTGATTYPYGSTYHAAFTVLNTGNVGIGTTGPAATLDVLPAGGSEHLFVNTAGCGSSYAAITLGPSAPSGCSTYTLLGDGSGGTYLNASAGEEINFRIGNITGMTLTSTGVSIGGTLSSGNFSATTATAGPGAQFSFSRPGGGGLGISLNSTAATWVIGNSVNAGAFTINDSNNFDSGYVFSIQNSTGNATFADSLAVDGNLTLAATNPTLYTGGSYLTIPYGLYVSGGTTYIGGTLEARNAIANDVASYLQLSGGTSGYTDVVGKLGINTASPDESLTVDGHVSSKGGTAPYAESCGTGTVSGTDTAGTVTVYGSPTACTIYFGTGYAATPTCVVTSLTKMTVGSPSYASIDPFLAYVASYGFEVELNYGAASSFTSFTSGYQFSYVCIGS